MNKKSILLCCALIWAAGVLNGQDRSTRGAAADPILNQPKPVTLDDVNKENTFFELDKCLRNKSLATSLIFTPQDVKDYVNLFANDSRVDKKEIDYATALERIESAVASAKEKMQRIGNAQNVTLMASKAYFGDAHELTHVIQHRVDIVDEKGGGVLYDVLFVKIGGQYKIFAVNDEF